jgi:protein-tyrosine phosphatase
LVKIVFICLGNICRSSLAEAVAKEAIKKNKYKNIEISSAGTANWHIGKPPCDKSQMIAKKFNLDISSYRSSQITNSNASNYDYFITADDSTYSHILGFNVDNSKVFKLGSFGLDNINIPDTYYINSPKEIENVYKMIETSVNNCLEFIILNESNI